MNEADLLRRKLERERKARQQAESILEQKSLALYEVNEQLKKFNEQLEREIEERNKDLVNSELRYRTLVETAQDIIYNISTDGHFLFVNSQAKALFGYDEEELIGRYFLDLIADDFKERVLNFYIEFREKKQEKSYLEFPVHRKDGDIKWVGQNVRRVELNNEVYFSAYARDITERIESDKALAAAKDALSKSETKYRSMIENMELGILEVDLNGTITNAYERFCKMTGFTREELVGMHAEDLLLHDEFREVMSKQHSDREKGIAGSYEVQLQKKDGTPMWVIISGAPFHNESGEIVGTVGIHYDITAEKQLQEDLREARLRAEQAQKSEQQFLASMSHEIRTPLNAIIGMTHILKETELSEEQRELLQIIVHSSGLLHSLINDILDISKIDTGNVAVRHEAFDILELLRSIRQTFKLKAREKNVNVILDINGELKHQVYGDSMLINQVMMNLVGNAEKFTAQGEVRIAIGIVHVSINQVRLKIQISDTGIGIDPKDLETIFDKFKQAGSGINKKYGGTGLGLTITRKLLQLMGSDIHVSSVPGEGSTFAFELDLELSDKPIAAINRSGGEWLLPVVEEGTHILIAEDNKLNQKYLGILLDKAGISYDIAENGAEAIAMAAEKHYPLILMDIQMPEVDGFEATAQIRNMSAHQDTIIVALTAMTMRSDELNLHEAGLDDFLTKPFTPNDLYSLLNSHIGSREQVVAQLETVSSGYTYSELMDADYLRELYADDIEYAADIFRTFVSNNPKEIDLLKSAVSKRNITEATAIVHKMKPSYGMVGFPEHSETCARLELLGNSQSELFFEAVLDFLESVKSVPIVVQQEIERMASFQDS